MLSLVLLLAACDREPDWRQAVRDWQWPAAIPDVPLVDQEGRDFRLADLSESWVLLGFVYTRCDDAAACPMTMHRMRATQEAWGARGGLRLLSLTLDPSYDTPGRLKAFGTAHGVDFSTWTLATGDPWLLGEALPSMFSILALPDGPGRIDHSVKIVLLRPGLVQEASWKDDEFTASDAIARIR